MKKINAEVASQLVLKSTQGLKRPRIQSQDFVPMVLHHEIHGFVFTTYTETHDFK